MFKYELILGCLIEIGGLCSLVSVVIIITVVLFGYKEKIFSLFCSVLGKISRSVWRHFTAGIKDPVAFFDVKY